MAQQKSIQETQKKLLRRISELKTFNEKNRQISKKREEISKSAIDLTNANENKIEKASKEGQISDDHANHAKFLNSINYLVQENTQNLDTNKLNEINENLKKISKQISDYTKATIDKQDTSIKHAVKPDKKASDTGKSKPSKPSKKSKDGMGLFGWLGTGLAGLLGLLPFIPMIVSTFRFLKFLVKGSWKILKGGFKAILWVGKNIAHLVKLSGRMILGVVELFTHPLRFLQNYLAKPLKLFVSGIVGNMLSKIPLLKNTKVVQDFLKGTKAGKDALNAAKQANNAQKIKQAGETVKKTVSTVKTTVQTAAIAVKSKLMDAFIKAKNIIVKIIPGGEFASKWLGGVVDWIISKLKPLVQKIEAVVSKTLKIVKQYAGKVWTILKKSGKKMAIKGGARALSFLSGLAIPGPGWVLSAALAIWMFYDFFKYIWDHWGEYDLVYVLPSAVVYALIGWDPLEKDADEFSKVEFSDPAEAAKISNSLTHEDLKEASKEELENLKNKIKLEETEYTKNLEHLNSKVITYKRNGQVLSAEESRKIQDLKIKQAELGQKLAKEQQDYIDRKNSPNWLDGEVEISQANYQKMVDYFWDKNKESTSIYDTVFYGDIDFDEMREDMEKYKKAAEKALKNNELVLAADQQSRAELCAKMLELYNSGTKNETDAQAIVQKIDRFENFHERVNKIKSQQAQVEKSLQDIGKVEISSEKPASNAKTPANPNGNLGANYNPGATLQTSTFSAAAGTPRAVAAANYALKNVAGTYGNCAKAVSNALEFGGGWKGYGRGHAFQTPNSLRAIGWTPLPYNMSYTPKIGDVGVIDKGGKYKSGTKKNMSIDYGHTAIYTSQGWVSDHKQGSQLIPSSYPDNKVNHTTIFRDTGNSTFASDYTYTGPSGKDTSPTLKPSSPKPTGSAVSSNPVVANASSNSNTTINNTQASLPIPKSSTTDLTDYWELQV